MRRLVMVSLDGIDPPPQSLKLNGIEVPLATGFALETRRRVMGEVCRIGLDIAKNVFQVHGVDKHGRDVLKKKLQRSAVLSFFANLPPCLVGIEACGGSYYWAREISKYSEIVDCDERIEKCDERINSFAKTDETCKRLLKVPGIGPLITTAIVAHVSNAHNYRNGRAFASSLGLTPREYSSGGKQKLLGISKRGNTYLRQLIIQGMRNIQRSWLTREKARTRTESWLWELVARRGKYVAVVALANKTARIIWAMLARGEEYRATMA